VRPGNSRQSWYPTSSVIRGCRHRRRSHPRPAPGPARDLIDPTIAIHDGRVVKRTGDGSIVEFRSVVDAVRCAIEVQNGMRERNAGLPEDRRIEFRVVGIHLGAAATSSTPQSPPHGCIVKQWRRLKCCSVFHRERCGQFASRLLRPISDPIGAGCRLARLVDRTPASPS
jgi:hypothetical protein